MVGLAASHGTGIDGQSLPVTVQTGIPGGCPLDKHKGCAPVSDSDTFLHTEGSGHGGGTDGNQACEKTGRHRQIL